MRFLWSSLIVLLMSWPSHADDRLDSLLESFEIAVSRELHAAYACQEFIGGLARYEVVRRDAEVLLSQYLENDEAHLRLAKLEQEIRVKAENAKLQQTLASNRELTHSDVVASCLDSLSVLNELVEHATASLKRFSGSSEEIETASVPASFAR